MKKINKIRQVKSFKTTTSNFEVTIKQDGKVIYQNETIAGVLSLAEHITKADLDTLEVEGVTQHFCFGPFPVQLFAFDQLRQKIEALIKDDGIIESLRKIRDYLKP